MTQVVQPLVKQKMVVIADPAVTDALRMELLFYTRNELNHFDRLGACHYFLESDAKNTHISIRLLNMSKFPNEYIRQCLEEAEEIILVPGPDFNPASFAIYLSLSDTELESKRLVTIKPEKFQVFLETL